jgi:hypothetical protein
VRFMLLAQLMWLWMSRSTYIALFEMITGRRSWHKTPHGHAEYDDEFRLADSAGRGPSSFGSESRQTRTESYTRFPVGYSVDGGY